MWRRARLCGHPDTGALCLGLRLAALGSAARGSIGAGQLRGEAARRASTSRALEVGHPLGAGSTPASEINPAVVTVAEEIGLDLSKEFPKPLTTDIVEAADVVITMGWADACPVFPGKRYLDWELPDPPASRSSSYRHRRLTAVGRTRERPPDTRRGHGIRLKMKSNSVPPLRDFSVIVPRAFR